MKPFLPLFALLVCALPAVADQRGDTPDTQPSTPQEQLAKFHVPPGFEVQLVAAEPDIQKPINLNFDAAGRLWVTGSELYPWPASTDANGQPIPDFDKGWQGMADAFKVGDKAPEPAREGRDTVRILSDFDETGRAWTVSVFADKLNIPSGVQPLPRGSAAITEVYGLPPPFDPNPEMRKRGPIADRHLGKFPKGDTAVVYSIPNIWLMADWDGDGFAESRVPLYTGFGYTDTHGGSSSYIHWIDGWIYGTHGFKNHSEVRDRNGKVTVLDSGNTYRFRPDGTAFEIYAHGQTNPFGLAFDPLGNLFSADSHSKPVYMLLRGGYYEGIGKQHDGLGFAPRITDDDHGSSAIAGIAYYADDKWPEEFRGNLFNGNPVTQCLNRDRLEWHGSTPKAIRMPDFLTCDDPWFRPVNLKLGPDGALYIADFYNPIIGHYEVPLTHPARDHTHGRIWRVVYRGENASAQREATPPGSTRVPRVGEGVPPSRTSGDEPKPDAPSVAGAASEVRRGETPRPTRETRVLPRAPDLTKLDAAGLVEKLADPSLEVRRLATNELSDQRWSVQSNSLERLLNSTDATRSSGLDSPTAPKALAAWVFKRRGGEPAFNSLPDFVFHTLQASDSPLAATAIALLQELHWEEHSAMVISGLGHRSPFVRRAAVEFFYGQSHSLLGYILDLLRTTPTDDLALIYSARRTGSSLLEKGGYEYEVATDLIEKNPAIPTQLLEDGTMLSERVADLSLAVKSSDSAAFLLAHLERTKLETPRAGEYLRHAVLYLPAEKLDAVVKLVGQVGNAPLPRKLALATNLAEAARQRGISLPEELTAWSQGVIFETLASNNDGLTKPAIAAVRDMKLEAKLAPLAKIARDEFRDNALRLGALEAAANLPASRDLLAAIFNDPRHMILRKRAAELLAQNGDTATVLAALPQAPWELALTISGAVAKNDAGAAALLDAIDAGKTSPRVLTSKTVAGALTSRPRPLRDRAAALTKDLPPEDARLDKVIADRAGDFQKAKPEATHGAQVFRQNCIVCHRFHNEGGNVGPNLDAAAVRGAQRLIEDILDPNRNVDPGFRQTIIETNDGQTFAGANVREQDAALLLTDATGKDLNVPLNAIKTRTQSPLSLMPPIFETQLSAGDFNDLLAFLLSAPP